MITDTNLIDGEEIFFEDLYIDKEDNNYNKVSTTNQNKFVKYNDNTQMDSLSIENEEEIISFLIACIIACIISFSLIFYTIYYFKLN